MKFVPDARFLNSSYKGQDQGVFLKVFQDKMQFLKKEKRGLVYPSAKLQLAKTLIANDQMEIFQSWTRKDVNDYGDKKEIYKTTG